MRLSIMTYCYGRALSEGTLTFQGMLEEFVRLGVPGVDLVRGHAAGWSGAALRARLDDMGLSAPVLLEPAALAAPDPAQRAAAVESLRPAIEMGQTLGTPLLMVLPGGASAEVPIEETRRWLGDSLQRACEFAEGSGVRIMVENHGSAWRLHGRVAHMEELCAAAPALRLCFDTGNFFLAGEDLDEAFARLSGRVSHVHCKDWLLSEDEQGVEALNGKRYQGTVIGQGLVPNREVLSRLLHSDYPGYFSVEYEGPDEPVAATAQAVGNLRRLLAEAA